MPLAGQYRGPEMAFDVDLAEGVAAVVLGAAGVPLILLARNLSWRIHSNIGRAMLVYPTLILGFLSVAGSALIVTSKVIAPVASAFWNGFG